MELHSTGTRHDSNYKILTRLCNRDYKLAPVQSGFNVQHAETDESVGAINRSQQPVNL